LLIHPSETLKEVMEGKNISEQELAQLTQTSEKYVRELLESRRDIYPLFARKLEGVFNISATFWINLQIIYNKEKEDFDE